ncbi:MAG: SprT family zinc-dependent metalloprotease [Oligoflexia bacterium]|nr:SprT family zinc-dependent metalloprotease [Oligoflexia bacterium]
MRRETIPFQYKNRSFSISLRYSSRKTVGISVHPDKKIEITAPSGTSFACIERVVERKSKWISNKLEELEKYQIMEQIKEYKNGQSLKLLGRDYMIKVIQIQEFEEEQIVKEKNLIKIYVQNSNQKKRISLLIEDWYRNEAMVYLAQKFEQCYKKIRKYGISKPLYYLRYMSQRWGSCTAKGNILLNPEIIQLPSHCIEYIIMHELCHLKYRNHSKEFYHFLDTVMPNWEDYSQALDSFLQV